MSITVGCVALSKAGICCVSLSGSLSYSGSGKRGPEFLEISQNLDHHVDSPSRKTRCTNERGASTRRAPTH